MGYGKWITGAIGWALGGPIGGILGYFIGSALESNGSKGESSRKSYMPKRSFSPAEERNSYFLSLLILTSAVMKADQKVMKSELDYIKTFLTRNFGTDATVEAVKHLKELLKKDVDVKTVGAQIKRYVNKEARLQLLYYLTGIARADGVVSAAEIRVLREIALALELSSRESEAIFAMFYDNTDSAYQILEIDRSASDEEIKKAYKTLAVKHHPDKVSHLGADVQRASEERFKIISEAYEKIRKERGIV